MSQRILKTLFVAASFALTAAAPSSAQEIDPVKIVRNAQQAFFYQGESFRARVKMTLTSQAGSERLRELTMLRINTGPGGPSARPDKEVRSGLSMPKGGDQRYFMYFHAPGDVRRMAFLVYKYPAREDDRWLFIPALNLVQRIAAKDSQSSFVGSDFTYEDVSGRDVEADEHKLLREEEHGGKPCYVIESVPKGSASYKRKLSWIDKTAWLPLKEEYYDVQGQLFKEFAAEDIQQIDGLPTITKRTMRNIKSGHQTVVEFSETKYRLALKPEEFSERALRNPPRNWIK
ncbi:MAG: outer membrane lipoprotein-sorting protein [Elusimicrobia bacterium]|nr:outer membrane lipoprotein-sorting protein [Elusimicrobiota bacterium]